MATFAQSIRACYAPAEADVIIALYEQIEASAVQMAVVDYKGFKTQDRYGRVITVTEKSEHSVRFGARSMAHVQSYGFPALAYNKAALDAIHS